MANKIFDDGGLGKEHTKLIMSKFLAEFEATKVLPSMQLEYAEVGFWYGLWLKITRQERPVVYPHLPESKGDTITFRRPHACTTVAAPPTDLEPDQL